MDGGLKIPVEDPSVRAEGDNRKVEGGKSKIIQQVVQGQDH